MYLPPEFALDDPELIARLVSGLGAADIVTHGTDGLIATLVPVLWDRAPAPGRLLGHISRGNPQWRQCPDGTASLAIVHGPQTYVSPNLYEAKAGSGEVVPTWNYLTVHFTGHVIWHHDAAWLRELVARLTDRHEATQVAPWSVDDAPDAFVASRLRAIVGLEFVVQTVRAKAKWSQNRSAADQARVRASVGDPLSDLHLGMVPGEIA